MWYRGLYGLLYGLVLVAAVAAAQDESTADQEQDAIQSYLGFMFQSLESHKYYPEYAMRNGLNGHVVLRFTVRRDGQVFNPELVKVTGHDLFGDAAKRALERVGQLPPFPADIRRRELLVEVPISYQIEDRSSPGMAKVVKWYRKAAEQGHAGAQLRLGSMYETGKGVLQDDLEAVKWYRMAAEQDSAGAQRLGRLYAKDRGLLRDDAEAVKWYHRAAKQGNGVIRTCRQPLREILRRGCFTPEGDIRCLVGSCAYPLVIC